MFSNKLNSTNVKSKIIINLAFSSYFHYDNAFSQITAECNACTCSFEIYLFFVFIVGDFHVLFLKEIIFLFHPQDKLNDVRRTDQDKNVLQKSNSDSQKTQ